MRISEIDLQCEDIMWFATDSNGNIFECTSAGCGNVPEYVCKSREETESLLDYFMEKAPVITAPNLLIPAEDNDLIDDIKKISSKGIFCFDVTDYDHDDKYTCVAVPERPINISDLPQDIQKMLSDHIYNGDVYAEHTITVKHAYSNMYSISH